MGWFSKKPDYISDRAQELNDEIAALEAQIRDLDSQLATAPSPSSPKLRSTARPHGAATVIHSEVEPEPAARVRMDDEPIFEEVDQNRLNARTPGAAPNVNGELGVRRNNLGSVIRRAKEGLRAPTTANPKLVNYLAAGSIQGLRPMRYEKRVARNRFLMVTAIVVVILGGIFMWIRNHH